MDRKAGKKNSPITTVDKAVRDLLYRGARGTQFDIAETLKDNGINASQTSVSRALKRLRAEKHRDAKGEIVWRLPQDPALTSSLPTKADLVVAIVSNDNMIIIHTQPGAAGQIAYLIDRRKPNGVLGTIAGDDTIFVAPLAGANLKHVVNGIRAIL